VELIAESVAWLLDPAHWTGRDAIPVRVGEHVLLSGLSVLVGTAIALPVGLAIGHSGRGALFVVTLANVGRALPSFALLVMAFPIVLSLGLGLGFWPTFVPLVLLAVPPVLTNAFVAVREVDRDVVEAARAMGMRGDQLLRRVEVPLGLPLIFAGIRIAAVQVVATATLGAVVASGGLGRYIVDGLALQDFPRVVVGAFLVAALALLTERLLGFLERRSTSPGMRLGGAAPVDPQPGLAA
jgi:osmoprotectant transport system permease protein